MSTMMPVMRRCAVCGANNKYSILTSTNTFGGSPDLDLRPPEMKRSTMHLWVQECPKCGYVSTDVSELTGITRNWLKSLKYLTCDGIDFASGLARRFYKYYLISLENQDTEAAFYAVLHAAWACDDANDTVNAKRCREIAIPLADALMTTDEKHKDTIQLMKADLMRRAGQFEQLIDTYESCRFDDKLLNQILKFQLEKARNKDDACYRVQDVPNVK